MERGINLHIPYIKYVSRVRVRKRKTAVTTQDNLYIEQESKNKYSHLHL